MDANSTQFDNMVPSVVCHLDAELQLSTHYAYLVRITTTS
jgi:hypothetical protein